MHASASGLQELGLRANNSTSAARPPAVAGLGFLVADASLRPIFSNHEAITILTYPWKGQPPKTFTGAYEANIRRSFLRAHNSPGSANSTPQVTQFKSGRRIYFCRAFNLDGNGGTHKPTAVLIVLERGTSESFALSQISQQFHLTRREQETVALLLEGLSNKEIANRLGISANTVKVFLSQVMIKMGASSRAGIVSKFMDLVLASRSSDHAVAHINGSMAAPVVRGMRDYV